MIRSRTAARALLLSLGATLVGVVALAAPASAHVTVNPREAIQGGYTRVAFRVPNESDTASTTKVEVFLPEQAPIASVSTMPVPGWTVAVVRGKPAAPAQAHGSPVTEVVTKLTWTADKASVIKAGQFQEFPVSLGPLPAVDRLVFKALQTYSDGKVVRWIEEPQPGAEEPANPAPVLTLTKAADGAAPAPTDAAVRASTEEADDDDEGGNGLGVGMGLAGLLTGLGGLVLGGLAFARTRKEPVSPTT